MDWTQIIVALVGGGALVAFFSWLTSVNNTATKVLSERVDKLVARVSHYEQQITEMENERVKNHDEILQARKESADKDERIRVLETENEKLKKQVAKQAQEIDGLQRKVSELVLRIDELQKGS
ncbi:MAG TPA: hypothetical protein PLU23_03320 [Anaerolineaceae bacterium]|nr:hypothetical protein [Anaerolineaceae bacterium]